MSVFFGSISLDLSNPMISLLVGLIGGFILSIPASLAWFIILARIAPTVKFHNYVSQVRIEWTKVGYRYRIRFWNAGRRDIIDIEIFVRLKIKNLDQNSATSRNISFYSIPNGYSRLPVIIPKSAKKERFEKEMATRTHIVRLDVSEIEELH